MKQGLEFLFEDFINLPRFHNSTDALLGILFRKRSTRGGRDAVTEWSAAARAKSAPGLRPSGESKDSQCARACGGDDGGALVR